MQFLPATSLFLGLVISTTVQAAADERPAPVPCIGSVCVNADLRSLLELPWLQVASPAAAPARIRGQRRMARAVRGEPKAVEAVLARWPGRWFDGAGLKALATLDAVCEDLGYWWRPRALLPAADGARMVVAFEPVPSGERPQRFRVATVTLQWPQDASRDEAAQWQAEFRHRYAGYASYPTGERPAVRWQPRGADGPSLKLFAPLDAGSGSAMALRTQPACMSPG